MAVISAICARVVYSQSKSRTSVNQGKATITKLYKRTVTTSCSDPANDGAVPLVDVIRLIRYYEDRKQVVDDSVNQ
jgi:hypothetical protein